MVQLPSLPHMEPEGLTVFKECVGKSKCYLEYGSGGSTIYAVETAKVPHVVSIDSDKRWSDTIRTSVQTATPNQLMIEHCDIGPVGDWGSPIDRTHVTKFWQYMCKPWHMADRAKLKPDLVLIDGRFRVASFLYTLMACEKGTKILFDDYRDREHYHIVEKFCNIIEGYGRLAVFRAERVEDQREIAEYIARYSVLWG
ncbi:hypothetical protein E2A64_06455 [Pseudohoeflea suaedae]|uniref:Class I SAM-dependent methyltransferase n=1 Tax=Pseudohoeflea suaedae TaxID=877384 RepID=A0A4R5PPE3_9HYPH|nr:hypothetical protein [Pseudohoeflea suaedae]TDH38733.1 hypothetical protein E2A64_06455 [Pseudohoeflea suaedae]